MIVVSPLPKIALLTVSVTLKAVPAALLRLKVSPDFVPYQVIAGIAAPDFWLGSFGLDPEPSNFSTMNDPQPSFLWTLMNQSKIPSLAWSYTAGAYYRQRTQASLVLGGYDAARFTPGNVTFNMYNDVARRFVVNIDSATTTLNGTTTILENATYEIAVDSTIPYLYLPASLCQSFQDTLGLTYDNLTQLYMVNDTQNEILTAADTSFSFQISKDTGHHFTVSFPYAAFAVYVSYPLYNTSTLCLPIKAAANETQYTLGRAFLQETYMIADYERSTFSISPSLWGTSLSPNIQPILSPKYNTTSSITKTSSGSFSSRMIIAIVCGVIGGLILVLLVGLLIYLVGRAGRRKVQLARVTLDNEPVLKAELDAKGIERPQELFAENQISEAAGTGVFRELYGDETQPELADNAVHEMAVPESLRIELEASIPASK